MLIVNQKDQQMEQTEITVLTVEEVISNELIKGNVTDAVIDNLKEKYMPLKIAGIEDKETYQEVKSARKECKQWRIAAEKICKAGREEATKVQKAWIAKEREVVDKISEVEDYLEKQEKDYEAAVEKDKADRRRKQEEQLILRQQTLSNMNALYADGQFTIGEVSFELSVVKECEQDIWEESILPKFKAEYEKVQALILEQERIKEERESELKRQQEELERKQRELAEKEAALKAAQEEQERKQREEEQRKYTEAKAQREAKEKGRMDQLNALGLRVGIEDGHMYFKGYDCWVSHIDITTYDDDKWNKTIDDLTIHIAKKKEEEEQKRLTEIESQKEETRKNELRKSRLAILAQYNQSWGHGDIVDPTEEWWNEMVAGVKASYEKKQREKWESEQEEKRKHEELKKQLEMEQAKDKEKWEEIIRKVNEIEVYEMRSSQYRKKAMMLREKLQEIKSL